MYRIRLFLARGTRRRPINTLNFCRGRLRIESVDLLHQDPEEDRLTP